MKQVYEGVYEDRGRLWTKNMVPGTKVYGEKVLERHGTEYRGWNPHRSKMAALAVLKRRSLPPGTRSVLYLGAASGTTVSHLSDMVPGPVFAVEVSRRSARDLVWNLEARANVIPIIADANQPMSYGAYISDEVDILVQDVAQRHQVEIFLANMPFLRRRGQGYLFVKARSIQVAGRTSEVYDAVRKTLRGAGLTILLESDMEPFHSDHRAFVIERGQA